MTPLLKDVYRRIAGTTPRAFWLGVAYLGIDEQTAVQVWRDAQTPAPPASPEE